MGVPPNRWFIRENPIEMDDDWGYPQIYGNLQMKLFNAADDASTDKLFSAWHVSTLEVS